jgi:HEAT repeat protein
MSPSNAQPATQAPATPLAVELEGALVLLQRAALRVMADAEPIVDLRPAALSIERALSALLDATDGRAEGHGAIVAAQAEIVAATGAVTDARGKSEGIDALVADVGLAWRRLAAAADLLGKTPPPAPAGPSEIRASEGLPRRHELTRPSLVPAILAPAPPRPPDEAPRPKPAKPRTFEELRQAVALLKAESATPELDVPPESSRGALAAPRHEAPPPGFSAGIGAATGDATFRAERARECFEEVAMVALQRAPLPGDDWRSARLLEARMLRAIDWIAALGPGALSRVVSLYRGAPVADAAHAFALAMTLGCFSGRDTLAAVEMLMLAGDRDEEIFRGFSEGLVLSPHESLALAMRSLSTEPDPLVRELATFVLGATGLATDAELVALAKDPSPSVAATALEHLGACATPALAGVIAESEGSRDPAVRRALWGAMVLSDHPRARRTLLDALATEDRATAAMWLAVGSDERDARELCTRMEASPSRALIEAVGLSGPGFALPALARLLAHEDEEIAAAAGAALERITGAGLREEVEVAAEEILVPDPPDAPEPDVGDARAPLAKTVSDPRDLPPPAATERVVRPSTNPAAWSLFLGSAEGRAFEPSGRYRRGKPYSPRVLRAELDGPSCTPSERRWIQRELIVRTGGFVRLDPRDWVSVQERALAAWEPLAARASNTPGRFTRPARQAR